MADEATNRAAFEKQAGYCDAHNAPITARLCRAIAAALDHDTRTGARLLDWQGDPVLDAIALRIAGGFHALWREGRAVGLDMLFTGKPADPKADSNAAADMLRRFDEELIVWLAGPPQTNEPARSAALMAGLHVFARHFHMPVSLLEIGSSAGLNLLIDRFAFDLGGVLAGPASSPVLIRPEWRGPPPPPGPVIIDSVRGVDIAPIDATNIEAERRLLAYIWADQPQRFERAERAIAMLRERPVRLERGDAADWVEARLAEPQDAGVARVLMHTIVWQYLAPAARSRIEQAMEAAGARATTERPLGWLSLESDRAIGSHDLVLRSWPGDGEPVLLGHSHPHSQWIEWKYGERRRAPRFF